MNESVGTIQSLVNKRHFHMNMSGSIRNRERVPQESRMVKQREKGRTLHIGIVLIFPFFAASKFLLALQHVEGFHISRSREGYQQGLQQQLLATVSLSKSTKSQLDVVPLKSAQDEMASINSVSSEGNGFPTMETASMGEGTVSDSNITSALLSNYSASGSFGSLLMQIRRKEAEFKLLNKSSSIFFSEDQALKLDTTTFKSEDTEESAATSSKSDIFSWIRKQDVDDIAIELDDSVSIRITNSVKDMTILEPPDANRIKPRSGVNGVVGQKDSKVEIGNAAENKSESLKTSTNDVDATNDDFPSLSRAEYYTEGIDRDKRLLAVSIASSIDSINEWQHFCQQSIGGLEPLVECIREGAESIREASRSSPSSSSDDRRLIYPTSATHRGGLTRREEDLQMASRSCRILRNLCALSEELAAIVTDGLLRANAAYISKSKTSLMDDLCTILREADSSFDRKSYKSGAERQKNKRRLFRRRKREKNVSTMKKSRIKSDSLSKRRKEIPHGYKEICLQCKLYVTQLLLAMTCSSDSAVDAIRQAEGLKDVLLLYSSYDRKERRRRWIRYPGELLKATWLARRKIRGRPVLKTSTIQKSKERRRQPFIEAASLQNNLHGKIQGTSNQVLAAIGYNEWVPKIPGQKGLRILCLDGGGARGMTAVVAMKCLVDSLGGMEVADCFDLVVGTSTGAIIAFLVGLNRETSEQAVKRYDKLIEKIFTKSAFSTPMLLFTTASYDESIFMDVLTDILGENTMLDSRADPAAPLVFAVTSKMSSNPTHIALFRNYNYNGGEHPDPFLVRPDDARKNLDLLLTDESKIIRQGTYPKKKGIKQPAPGTVTPDNGSRHPGSFRILQKYALRASTAAPTVFKPVLMGGEMYCDGGMLASNPSAVAIHEARTIFPNVPIELVVSIGTGGFTELKSEPRIGWDGIIGQIVNSATDAEQIHHILEDVLGDGTTAQGKSSVSNTSYMRFNPTLGMPDEFPIDVTDPEKLQQIKTITRNYMEDPEQQRKLEILADILKGRSSSKFRRWLRGSKVAKYAK